VTRRGPGAGHRAARVAALLLAAVLALAGCRGGEDPATQLEQALVATLDTEVAFELRAEADRAALEQLGEAAGDAAQFLSDFRVVGAREPGGATTLAVELAAGQPVLEAVVLPDGELRLRTGLGELLGLGGASPADALEPELERRGASQEQRRALTAGFEGDWIAITDAGGIEGALGDADETRDPGAVLDLERLLASVEVTDATEDDGRQRLDVLVDVTQLLGEDAADGVDERLPALVELEDGLLRRVRVELSDELDEVDDGRVRLDLRLSDHGDAEVGPPPEVAASVTMAELEELLALLRGA
jgi:hypothetical protein